MIRDQDLRTSFKMWALDSEVLGQRLDAAAGGPIERVTAQGLVEAARLAAHLLDEDWIGDAPVAGGDVRVHGQELDERMQVQVGRWLAQTRAMATTCGKNGTALGARMAHALGQAVRLVELRMVGYVVTVDNTLSLSQ